jgi:predicted nucleic-acid-binding Zn-ribbon protein
MDKKKCPKSKSKKNFPDNILKNRYFMFSIIKIQNTKYKIKKIQILIIHSQIDD